MELPLTIEEDSGMSRSVGKTRSFAWTVPLEVLIRHASDAGGRQSVELRGEVQAGDESLVSLIHRCAVSPQDYMRTWEVKTDAEEERPVWRLRHSNRRMLGR